MKINKIYLIKNSKIDMYFKKNIIFNIKKLYLIKIIYNQRRV